MLKKIIAPVAILAILIAGTMLIPQGDADQQLASGNALAAEIEPLKHGDMAKLTFHDVPFNPLQTAFTDAEGAAMTVADLSGKVVVMNFWATWCPPCRAEMPSIDRLAGELAGDDVAVVTVSTDRGDRAKIDKFFEEIEVQNLTVYRDQNSDLAREAGALGLPITLIIDRDGREVARLIGDAEWDSDEAKTIVRRVAELTN